MRWVHGSTGGYSGRPRPIPLMDGRRSRGAGRLPWHRPSQAAQSRCILCPFLVFGGVDESLCRAVVSAAIIFLGVSYASAQETCLLYQRGTVDCPAYGAPAATAVPGPSMDGGVATVPNGSSVTLFGGRVPPNGFMIRVFVNGYGLGISCFVNDNGPAGQGIGFFSVPDRPFTNGTTAVVSSGTFTSPHGYKPIGPVSIYCQNNGGPETIFVAARGW
jgi:hypothetical protein